MTRAYNYLIYVYWLGKYTICMYWNRILLEIVDIIIYSISFNQKVTFTKYELNLQAASLPGNVSLLSKSIIPSLWPGKFLITFPVALILSAFVIQLELLRGCRGMFNFVQATKFNPRYSNIIGNIINLINVISRYNLLEVTFV